MGNIDNTSEENEVRNTATLTVGGNDQVYDFEQLGITFDSTEREILAAVQGIVREANISLEDDEQPGEYTFTVRKAVNTQMIYIYPKDPAGK